MQINNKNLNGYLALEDITTKFCDSMIFNFLNNLLNISIVLFNDFDSMLPSSLGITSSSPFL